MSLGWVLLIGVLLIQYQGAEFPELAVNTVSELNLMATLIDTPFFLHSPLRCTMHFQICYLKISFDLHNSGRSWGS